MTQPDLFTTVTPDTYTDRVAQLLLSRPGEWIDGLEIAKCGGAYAWRSRLSDVRRKFGLTIENQQRRVGRKVISEYRVTR